MTSVSTLAVTASQTLDSGANFFLIDAVGGNIICTMPNIVADGMDFFFKRFDSSATANTVTIQGFNVSQTIDGQVSVSFENGMASRLIAYTSVWYSGSASVPAITAGNYIYSYDTTTQAVAVANTFQDVTFDTNGEMSGWTHTAGTATFTCNKTGKYNIEYGAAASVTLALTPTTGSIIVTKNGTEISGSQCFTSITSLSASAILQRNFLVSIASGDAIVVRFTGSATTIQLSSGGSGATQPTISLNITRIS